MTDLLESMESQDSERFAQVAHDWGKWMHVFLKTAILILSSQTG